ncbi:MAG: hypothetical protein OXC79_03505 [Candidatus Poribacteria bacterium]|nr:hypothetical protein [Candidatus Poribacteria bacterium]
MKHSSWTEADSRNAKRIWAEYQKQHDITERIGQTAGIDPKSGRIWFGDSAIEIVERRRAEGLTSPLFFERVGFKAYFRKVGRRQFTALQNDFGNAPIDVPQR